MKKLLCALPVLLLAVAAAAPTYTIKDRIAGPDGGWDYASIDAGTNTLYVAHGASVLALEIASGQVRSFGTIARAHAVVPLPGGLLLVTSGGDDSVRLIDPTDGSEKAKIGVGKDPDAAFYDPFTRNAVVANAKAGSVSLIDPVKAAVVRTITLKPGLEFAVTDGKGMLFVNNEDANEIERADLRTGAVTPSIAMPGCEGPSGLAFDAANHRLISACANGKAAVVDTVTSKMVALLDIGRGPDAVLLDAGRHVALIPCGKDGKLEVIALGDRRTLPTVVAHAATELGARTGALDLRTGFVYLPTARFNPPTPPATRPQAVPGTFHILVVGSKA